MGLLDFNLNSSPRPELFSSPPDSVWSGAQPQRLPGKTESRDFVEGPTQKLLERPTQSLPGVPNPRASLEAQPQECPTPGREFLECPTPETPWSAQAPRPWRRWSAQPQNQKLLGVPKPRDSLLPNPLWSAQPQGLPGVPNLPHLQAKTKKAYLNAQPQGLPGVPNLPHLQAKTKKAYLNQCVFVWNILFALFPFNDEQGGDVRSKIICIILKVLSGLLERRPERRLGSSGAKDPPGSLGIS